MTAIASPAGMEQNSLTGVVAARVQSDLGFRVAGKVLQRYVDAGQIVRRGQPLMRLDANDLALAADAQRRAVDAAAARLELAVREERRIRPIAQSGFATKAQYDRAQSALEAARADLAAARAQAGVAANNSGYAILRADADGVVMQTLVEPGQVVVAGQPVVRLAQSGPREAIVNVPESARASIGTGAMVSVYGQSGSFAARLRQLSAQADPTTRTYEARYILSGPGENAPLGATVTVHPQGTGAVTAGVTVPIGALIDPGRRPGVWVVDERASRVRFRPVRVASVGEETALLADGVRPGERVIALGAHMLHEGDAVRFAR